MTSPLDPVSVPLYILGFLGGFPLVPISDNPNDWDWDNCSAFKKNKFRLIWCYVLHTIVIAILSGIVVIMFAQDFNAEILNNVMKSNNLRWIEILVYLFQPIFLTLVTFAFISALNQCEPFLSKICYVTGHISRNSISDDQLRSLSWKNLRKILFFILCHLFVIFPIGYVFEIKNNLNQIPNLGST